VSAAKSNGAGETYGPDGWQPTKRRPLARAEEAASATPVELRIGFPADTAKIVSDLVEAQKAAAEKLGQIATQNAEILKLLQSTEQSATRTRDAMMRQLKLQSDSLTRAIEAMGTMAKAIEKSTSTPRRVTLQRDASGVATEAVSRPIKEGLN
jgi:hypothetical protein